MKAGANAAALTKPVRDLTVVGREDLFAITRIIEAKMMYPAGADNKNSKTLDGWAATAIASSV